MGQCTKIEWATHTFNPWWGCVKVSEACKNCYAETFARRLGQQVWGPGAQRRTFGDAHWSEPIKWNTRLDAEGGRERVFCASMADVFEDRRDLDSHRERLWDLIAKTPRLDWLLLTKRPDIVRQLTPWGEAWPENVWIGTTVENQLRAEERLARLAEIPATVRFISAEPLLGPVDLSRWMSSLHWVISGGESGPRARPASPAWFRNLHLQCMAHEVPFHFKQWGDWAPGDGENLARCRTRAAADGTPMVRIGKKRAGRSLDGRVFDELPAGAAAR
ncbi:MAG: phage Gp37/Gp68 family protein [Azospirillaceae bacterium]